MRKLTCLLFLSAVFAVTRSVFAVAVVVVGDNPSAPPTVTTYTGGPNSGFTVAEAVFYDPAAGLWEKQFQNTGDAILSGQNVAINETFTNFGLQAWTDWHEQILSTTTVNGDSNYPGFLFSAGSLSVFRDGVALTQGTDYTLVTDQVFNRSESDADWSTISLFFKPASDIQIGDTLQITKQIYEVFGNASVWEHGEIALVGQYPTVPEPTSISLAILGAAGLWLFRLSRHGRTGGR